MTKQRALPIFVLCLTAGGIACLVSVAGVLLRTREDAYRLTTTGAVLFMLAAACGVLAVTVFRGNCRRLARRVSAMTATGRLEPMAMSDVEVRPLLIALNDLIDYANRKVSAAAVAMKEMELQLKVAQLERQHGEAVIRSISDAVLVTDKYDELVLANESAAKALAFRLDDSARAPVERVLSDAKVVEMIREMRQSGSINGRRVVEHRVRQGSGERTYKVTLSCVADADVHADPDGVATSIDSTTDLRRPPASAPAGVVCVLHDMTREKEIAQMKNDFVSHVSHEIRTPLASIKAYVEMLVDGEAGDEKTRREFYEIIQTEANRLGRLIDNILNISRIESGLVKVNKQPQSLSVILREAIEVIAPQAKTKNITIEERVAPAFYQTLADKDMLYQAVLNLLSNSVKYTPEGGKLTVETEVDEANRRVVTRITDTGVGIPEKDLPFVFEKFYRVEANNRMAKGTGLGLSLVKHIIEAVHQGRVFVTSSAGQGSTFGFELSLI